MIELENEVGRKGERRELEGLGVSSKKKNQKKKKKKNHVHLWEKRWEVLEVKDFVDWSFAA